MLSIETFSNNLLGWKRPVLLILQLLDAICENPHRLACRFRGENAQSCVHEWRRYPILRNLSLAYCIDFMKENYISFISLLILT